MPCTEQFRERVTPRKREYLRTLNDLEWHSATEVAALLEVGGSGAAKVLSDLAQMKLVVWQAPDAYAITKAGQEALSDQLRSISGS